MTWRCCSPSGTSSRRKSRADPRPPAVGELVIRPRTCISGGDDEWRAYHARTDLDVSLDRSLVCRRPGARSNVRSCLPRLHAGLRQRRQLHRVPLHDDGGMQGRGYRPGGGLLRQSVSQGRRAKAGFSSSSSSATALGRILPNPLASMRGQATSAFEQKADIEGTHLRVRNGPIAGETIKSLLLNHFIRS